MILGSVFVAAFLLSFILTLCLLRFSPIRRLVDLPNPRSSHSTPKPRGGGLSIVAVTTCGIIILHALGWLSLALSSALVLGGLGIAAIGFWDDIRSAPIAVRMAIHFSAAVLALYCVGSISAIHAGKFLFELGAAGPVLTVLAIVWILNLFNFMDGIDGIAASEAVFVLLAFAGLEFFHAQPCAAAVAPALIAAGASLGFLMWNWPPAAIFMGDSGSGYLGYVIAVLGIDAVHSSAVNVYAWLILGGVFFVDATLTLCRRLLRGEKVSQAHRSHAYQWLARRWGSHASVTITVIAIDLVWLLPCAALAVQYPASGLQICAVAFTPLIAGALLSGSGRAE